MAADRERRGGWQRVAARSAVPVALLVVAAALYGPYVAEGGLTSDDWANGDSVQRNGYLGAVDSQFKTLGSKPLLALLLPLPHAAFGVDAVPHLALGIALVGAAIVHTARTTSRRRSRWASSSSICRSWSWTRARCGRRP